jgi:hypothetical protein
LLEVEVVEVDGMSWVYFCATVSYQTRALEWVVTSAVVSGLRLVCYTAASE